MGWICHLPFKAVNPIVGPIFCDDSLLAAMQYQAFPSWNICHVVVASVVIFGSLTLLLAQATAMAAGTTTAPFTAAKLFPSTQGQRAQIPIVPGRQRMASFLNAFPTMNYSYSKAERTVVPRTTTMQKNAL